MPPKKKVTAEAPEPPRVPSTLESLAKRVEDLEKAVAAIEKREPVAKWAVART